MLYGRQGKPKVARKVPILKRCHSLAGLVLEKTHIIMKTGQLVRGKLSFFHTKMEKISQAKCQKFIESMPHHLSGSS